MRNKIIILGIILLFGKTSLCAELDKKYEPIHLEAAKLVAQGEYKKAEQMLEEFLSKEKDKADPMTMQTAYSRYAEVKFIQGQYKEAADLLQTAIEQYDSPSEQYLERDYKEYKKYITKPKLDVHPWPDNKESCEALKGIWIAPVNYEINGKMTTYKGTCNLSTTDHGKECSDSTECQGYCGVDQSISKGTKMLGKCSERIQSLNGCVNTVFEGVVSGETCD